MERRRDAAVSTFYHDQPLESGATVSLPDAAAHHARVKRLVAGDGVRLTDGAGRIATGAITRMSKSAVDVELGSVRRIARPAPLELYAPVGDRERMLWLAEKATELAITAWQPVVFRRSRSVSPRGEGAAFAAKIRARMISALEQSGGAWLPDVRPEIDVEAAARVTAPVARYLLDPAGSALDAAPAADGAAIILGPEGGFEPDERGLLIAGGWRPARLATTILRFETAGIAAVAIVRAALTTLVEDTDG